MQYMIQLVYNERRAAHAWYKYMTAAIYRKWRKIHCRENFVGEEDYEIKQNENFQKRNILYANIYVRYHDFARLLRMSAEKAFLKNNEPSLPIFWASVQRQCHLSLQQQRICLSRFLAL